MNSLISKYLFYLPVTLLKGERVLKFLKLYKESQYWPLDKIRCYQEESIKKLLEIAVTAKYYETLNIAELLDLSGEDFFREYSKQIPILTKQDIINNGSKLLTDNPHRIAYKTTGGSTGEPVTIAKSSVALARERAATWRAYEWAGVKIGSKQARFWGVPHTKLGRFKASLTDFVSNRRRISAFEMDASAIELIYKRIMKYKPEYLYGYVSAIKTLAQYSDSLGIDVEWPFKAIITTSEVLTKKDRSLFESAFDRPIFNEYGCGEVGSIAHECSEGNLHIMSENVYLEESENGEIIITDLHNYAMPLIRYNIGDFGSIEKRSCSCSITLPVLSNVKGRAYDVIETPEGRKIHPEAIIYIFEDIQKNLDCFSQFQVIQKSLSRFEVNLIASDSWSDSVSHQITEKMKSHISPSIIVDITLVAKIPREKSGKMRVVKVDIN